jgi:hypothetical protein
MTSKRRRQRGKLRAFIRAGIRSGKSEPLDMVEIKVAARQLARESASRILEKPRLAFPKNRVPVPPEAFHDLDHDLEEAAK